MGRVSHDEAPDSIFVITAYSDCLSSGRAPCQLAWQEASLAASTCRELSTLPFLAHFAARGGEVTKEEGTLCVAVLATKLIHLPDEPAGVGQIGTPTVGLRTSGQGENRRRQRRKPR